MIAQLITWQLQGSIVFTFAFVAVLAMRHTRARHRHDVWLFSLFATAVMPWLPRVARAPADFAPMAIVPKTVAQTTADLPLAAPGLPLAVFLWLSVSALLLLRLVVAHVRLRRLTAAGQIAAPFTAGLLRPRAYVPRHLAGDAAVLAHEGMHVKMRDPLTRFFADVYAALAWPNPLVWLARAQLMKEQELAADEAVLDSGITPSTYAEVLVANARAEIPAAVAMASALPGRITRILQPRRPQRARVQTMLSCTLLASAVALSCCESLPPPDHPLIDPLEIQQAFRAGRDAIRACYEEALAASPTLTVDVMVELEIATNGEPRAVRINDVPDAPGLTPCLMRAVSALRFLPREGGPVQLQYPLIFTPETASVREKAKTHFVHGNELLLKHRMRDAIDRYTEAANVDPTFALPHRGLGIANARMGNGDAAVEHYKLYLQLFPSAPDAEQVRNIVKEYESAD